MTNSEIVMKEANSEIDGKREVVGGTAIDKFRDCNERDKFRDCNERGTCCEGDSYLAYWE